MSCFAGPEIVNNGLVFHYDMNNTQKSWKGKPTNNILIGTPVLTGVQGITLNFVGMDNEWRKFSMSGTWNASSYPFSMKINSSIFTGGVAYSARCLLKTNVKNKFATFGGLNYVNDPNMASGGTTTVRILKYDINGLEIIELKREGFIYSTGYANPTTSQPGYISSRPISNGTVFDPNTDFVWIKEIQVEEGLFCTSYVNSSRSATEAILDLTKNNTITVNNLSYSSNNTFSFDGTDDYVLVPNNFIPANSPLTISIWIKILTMSTNGKIVDCMNDSVAWDGFSLLVASGQIRFSLLKTYDPNVSVTLGTNSSVIANTWYSIDATYDGSSVKLYINGKLDNSGNYSSGYDVGQPNIGIGARPSGVQSTNCQIPKIQMYTRALSATEIKQNFEATRDRFGI